MPTTVTQIGEGAFCNTALTEVTIPSGVTVISEDAFNYCTKLESVTLHDNITEIGKEAFYNTALTEINYPANVATVGKNLFGTAPLEIVRVYSAELVKKLNASTGYNIAPYSVPQVWIKKTLSANITDWLAQRYAYICEQQYKGEDFIVFSKEFIAAHTHLIATEWSSDESGHWHACYGCDKKADFEAHRYTDACDAECNICGYIRTVTHSYSDTWSTDSKKHWHQCSVCGNKADESAHIPGPAATETSAQTCTTCGYVLQAPLGHEHSFGAAWQTDAFSHWRVCACGAKTDEGSHIWDNGTVTQPPQAGQTGTRVYTCTTCGAQKSETIDALPPETDSEPAPTEPAPTAPAPTEPAPAEPAPTEPTPLMLRIVKSPWTWGICGGILLLTIVLTIFLIVDKKHPEEK